MLVVWNVHETDPPGLTVPEILPLTVKPMDWPQVAADVPLPLSDPENMPPLVASELSAGWVLAMRRAVSVSCPSEVPEDPLD